MKTKLLLAAASAAFLLSSAAGAQSQTQPQSEIFRQLLGAVFGSGEEGEQALESDWSQGGRPFAQRRATLEARIDSAVREGSVGRAEADRMQGEFNEIVRLEAQYSAGGVVSPQQRRELRARYRALSQQVGDQSAGQTFSDDSSRGQGPWQMLSTRNADFEQRIAARLRSRDLTRTEATRLRAEWQALGQIESGYQRDGLDARERADLWARYATISTRLGGGVGDGLGDDRNVTRWSELETRLAAAERNGRIDRTQVVHVRAQLDDLTRLDAAYAAAGYSAAQRAYLTKRFGELDQLMIGTRR